MKFNIFKKKPSIKIGEHNKETPVMDKVLLCAKDIIDNGTVEDDNTSNRNIPSVKFKDVNNNTLYIEWFYNRESVLEVRVNDAVVPETYDKEILQMAKQRIQVLRKEHLERVIAGMKG